MSQAASTRTVKQGVTFRRPFRIGKDEELFPAGSYEVLAREAVHEGNERTVYVRISTTLLVKSPGTTRHCEVRAADLDEAMRLDSRAPRQAAGAAL